MQRNWQHRVHKTKDSKTKTQHKTSSMFAMVVVLTWSALYHGVDPRSGKSKNYKNWSCFACPQRPHE